MVFTLLSCKNQTKEVTDTNEMENEITSSKEEELYRPNFHFTPKEKWVNDPNGMFYYNGYYHLYFQHYPDSSTWGPMHWGHAISMDMITWKEMPIALYPDKLGHIWSGSAVVDNENTSGFGTPQSTKPVVAMYTNSKENPEAKEWLQTQGIAYSLDEGKTFTKYVDNPAIANPGIKDFRDPKMSWDAERERWIMVLAAGDKIMFYSSKDLKDWELLSDFGADLNREIGAHGGVWECPDFFPLQVKGSEEVKWVLFVSINPGGPNGGSATQYFIGDFDGTNFTLDNDFKEELEEHHDFWIDFGRDNYAGVSWSNIPASDGRRLYLGWMSNWQYARVVPTETWRNGMTIPRTVKLIKSTDGYRLGFDPVKELSQYRGKKYKTEAIAVSGEVKITEAKTVDLSRTEIKFNSSDVKDNSFSFRLDNSLGDVLIFGYDATKQLFYVDRSKAGITDFSEDFPGIAEAPRTSGNTNLSATVLLDKTSIELFFDDGETVMTEIFFPNIPFETLSIVSENQGFVLDSIEVHELNFN